MKIDLFNVEKQTAATVFSFIMDSVPSEDLEKLDFYLCQEAQDDNFNMAFNIVKPHFRITLFSDRLEIENNNSVCKVPNTEFSHIEIY